MSIKAIAPSIANGPRTCRFFLDLLDRATSLFNVTQLHAQIIHHGFQCDLPTATKLTQKLFDFHSPRHARSLCFSLPKPDIFLFNVAVKGLSITDSPFSAISLFALLRTTAGFRPNDFTYSFVLPAAASFGDLRTGMSLHAMAIVDGLGLDLFVGSVLVDMYFKLWREESAQKVFDGLPEIDTILCNTMISGFVRNCCFKDSIKVFGGMISGDGPQFDMTTVVAVLPAVAELQELRLGMEIHCLGIKFGFHCNVSVVTGLISLYSKCGNVQKAKSLFEEIQRKDLISYNAMISGFTGNGETASSVKLFKQWIHIGERFNSGTIVGLIPVNSPFGHLSLINCIHIFSVKSGVISSPSVSTALTTVYCRLNEMEAAQRLFDESPDRTLASWNTMVAGYTQNGLIETSISLFRQMLLSNFCPNPVTIASILSACAQLGSLSLGKWVHDIVRSKGFISNVYVSTALIDMYAKCGSIAEARQLFDLMPEKNEVTWNAMISGYGLHGLGKEALVLFYEMLNSGISPTAVTFLSALYACSHAGLVREGEEIFYSMVHEYRFEPLAVHYACMVDILGRAGKLQDALGFINRMPVEPGPPVWGAFLGACKIHKDTTLARVASERLFELDPENIGYYVLVSNIYSAERNYPEAATVRQIAKKRKLEKTPGCTLIEISQIPHIFTSGDQSHPQSAAIYSELERLLGKIKEAGFKAETVTALHDVEEEEKEQMMKVHSEKLAIAFGLISTGPGTEIRIIKNLRVCLDCHTATKFISKVTNRVIVVRDANRFHHFKGGECSCKDYW